MRRRPDGAGSIDRFKSDPESGPGRDPGDGIGRRGVLRLGIGAAAFGRTALAAGLGLTPSLAPSLARADWSGGGRRSLGESLLGEAKYPDDFAHFDYVNPDAPKGGVARLESPGQYDSFNPFNRKGDPTAASAQYSIESLMTPSLDEGSTHYGLLAEWMERAPDDGWVAFRLREAARWQDGEPVTVEDVKTSFRMLVEKGHPRYRFYYQNVSDVVDEGDRIVRFIFDQTNNRELPHIMGQLNVFPAHWWAERAFDETIAEPLLGSGPYKVSDFEMGRFVELARVTDYWGADLSVNLGQHNFDTIRIEFFLDRDTAFESFKKGEVDFWDENSAKRWAERYDFPAHNSGKVVKRNVEQEGPKQIQGIAFNGRRPHFQDRRVREAFALAYDFEWTNRAVSYDQYARPSSYFQGSTELMATGVPEGAELALLEPYRDQLPPELFEKPFEQPTTDGSGQNRGNLRKAQKLLQDAGYSVRNRQLVDPSGQPVKLEFLIRQASLEATVEPYLQNLETLGVDGTLRFVDDSQYIARLRSFDFDLAFYGWANSESPGNEQREYWASSAADAEGGRNLPGVKNPVVDALIDKVIEAPDRAALEAASRALDRVLLWEHYAILQLYVPVERIAFWNRFGAPEPLPPRDVGFPTVWWFDSEKAAKL